MRPQRDGAMTLPFLGSSPALLPAAAVFVLRSRVFVCLCPIRIFFSRGGVSQHAGDSPGNSTGRISVCEMFKFTKWPYLSAPLDCTAPCLSVLYGSLPYCTTQFLCCSYKHRAVLSCAALCNSAVQCTALRCTVYCALLSSTVLYCTLLYSTVL